MGESGETPPEVARAYKLRNAAQRFRDAERLLTEGDGVQPGGGHASEASLADAAEGYVVASAELARAVGAYPEPETGG